MIITGKVLVTFKGGPFGFEREVKVFSSKITKGEVSSKPIVFSPSASEGE